MAWRDSQNTYGSDALSAIVTPFNPEFFAINREESERDGESQNGCVCARESQKGGEDRQNYTDYMSKGRVFKHLHAAAAVPSALK